MGARARGTAVPCDTARHALRHGSAPPLLFPAALRGARPQRRRPRPGGRPTARADGHPGARVCAHACKRPAEPVLRAGLAEYRPDAVEWRASEAARPRRRLPLPVPCLQPATRHGCVCDAQKVPRRLRRHAGRERRARARADGPTRPLPPGCGAAPRVGVGPAECAAGDAAVHAHARRGPHRGIFGPRGARRARRRAVGRVACATCAAVGTQRADVCACVGAHAVFVAGAPRLVAQPAELRAARARRAAAPACAQPIGQSDR